jgi:glutathione S-transferase
LLEELNLDYDIKVHFRQKDKHSPPELKQVHPLGKSPLITIQAPRLETPLVLAESGAIVEYLSDHFGQQLTPKRYPDGEDGLIGAETKEWLRYRVSAICFTATLFSLIMSEPTSQ